MTQDYAPDNSTFHPTSFKRSTRDGFFVAPSSRTASAPFFEAPFKALGRRRENSGVWSEKGHDTDYLNFPSNSSDERDAFGGATKLPTQDVFCFN